MKPAHFGSLLLLLAVVAGGVASCADEQYPLSNWEKKHPSRGSSAPPVPGDSEAERCAPARSEEPIPARLAISAVDAPAGGRTVFVYDVFSLFKSTCGGCHVEASLGGFQVSPLDFADKVDGKVLARIRATDPAQVMPPGGKLASQRPPGDPVLELASLVEAWIAAGRPRDAFDLPAEGASGNSSVYALSDDVADGMTNIGDCVPEPAIVASERTTSDALDAYFAASSKNPAGTPAQRIGLPERLDQTDLVSMDGATLARHGVVAYAPAYPLWSDGAGKLRHVRVPRGQSIRFDRARQEFDIPPNTRFYKTFLKKIVDVDGSERFRKIETRVIVVRPDVEHPDGTFESAALFGTYAWNDAETEATLVTDPLRNGEPFADRLITYVDDEPKAAAVRARKPRNLQYALQDAGAIRHHAIPGRDRCVQCHMGSPGKSFVLGFRPVQVARRPMGEGGVYEPAGPDELTQLDRLIAYGVISGVSSPADILPLEASQGGRAPRNEHELVAQAYMLGNCSHCHNPRGFPSVSNPVLAPILNFLPGPDGGIFQFPLDRVSPRITRGLGGSVPIPYITPSLVDYPSHLGLDFWTPKWGIDDLGKSPASFVMAPFRSLIYRNVDSPFTYADDLALFPHMPMNTPGFDCRAPRIMADWMVSIPAVRKNASIPEYAVRDADGTIAGGMSVDESPQPYVEVKPGDPGYDFARLDAEHRLDAYHSGTLDIYEARPAPSRYSFCPDTSDVVDPQVLKDPKGHPVPIDDKRGVFQGNPLTLAMVRDGVPDRAHWVVTDLSDPPGDWSPRRPDWRDVLVDGKDDAGLLDALRGASLSPTLRAFATTDAPFGFWAKKPGCSFASVPKAADFVFDPPRWMKRRSAPLDPADPVYVDSPGAAIFQMICINCHGPNADSRGRLSDNLLIMTGGDTRVANLRDGLFGPSGGGGVQAGENRIRVFGPVSGARGTADDWGARYMAWMGLGGTQRTIPASILAIVSNTEVLGSARAWLRPAESANMLSTAKSLCGAVLLPRGSDGIIAFLPKNGTYKDSAPLIEENGDAEMWRRLCEIDNAPPVRALYVDWSRDVPSFVIRGDYTAGDKGQHASLDLYPAAGYPANAPVGDDQGRVASGVAANNRLPWCLRRPLDPAARAKAQAYVDDPAHVIGGRAIPFCPESLVPPSDASPPNADPRLTSDAIDRWATRGAINAGMSVFLYLDAIAKGTAHPKPRYDQCEVLP